MLLATSKLTLKKKKNENIQPMCLSIRDMNENEDCQITDLFMMLQNDEHTSGFTLTQPSKFDI